MRHRVVELLAGDGSTASDGRVANTQGIERKGLYRILVCRPNHRLGNLLMLTPLLAELARDYPGAQVDLVVGGEQATKLFRGFPNVGTVHALPRHALRQPWKLLRVLHRLRLQHYDLAIDPDVGSRSSRLLVDHCRATHRIGFAGKKRSRQLDCAMPIPDSTRHMGQLPVALLRWAMRLDQPDRPGNSIPALDLRLTAAERAWGRQKLDAVLGCGQDRARLPVIALYIHATAAKCHPRDWWLQLLAALRSSFPHALFVEILPAHGQTGLDGLVPGYFSSKPRRVAAVIAATRMIVAADCGIMHLACASRGPVVVGLFQCTDPEVYGPYGSGNCAISTNGRDPIDICASLGREGDIKDVLRLGFRRPGTDAD
ncbi:MAG: glycosyltransferase family 9 protein [Dokdonella sp.]